MTQLSDSQRKALDINRNLVITAGAGSGKTTVLVQRYLNLLIHQPALPVKNILAITFTEKAAAEMKDRIFNEINRQFATNRAFQGRLFEILNQLQEAQIFTIHSFCSQILRQFPVESEQNPEFAILSEVEMDELLNQVFRSFMLSFEPSGRPDEIYIMKALREYPVNRVREFFFTIYRNRAVIFEFLEAFHNESPEAVREFWEKTFLDFHRNILNDLSQNRQFWTDLHTLTSIPVDGGSRADVIQKELLDLLQKMNEEEKEQIRSARGIISLLTKNDGGAYASVPGGKKNWGEEGVEIFRHLSSEAARYSSLFLPFDPVTEKQFSEVISGLASLFTEMLQSTENMKKSLNVLDFDDLQIRTLALLQRHPEVRNYLRKQYQFILVDEFQDIDILQHHIIFFLVSDQLGTMDPNRLFIVGDPKQSIFGFRNTDVGLFHQMMGLIGEQQSDDRPILLPDEKEPISSSEMERKGIIELAHNYRSSSSLIRFFNRSFENIFRQETEFDVPFQQLQPGRKEFKQNGSSPVLTLMVEQDDTPEHLDIFLTQARQIAVTIHEITDPGNGTNFFIPVDEGLRQIQYGDIAVLIRSRTHLAELEQTFRDVNIPYQTHKGIGFFQKPEIHDIFYVLKSISHPEDNFAFVSVLRSHYIGISDTTLFFLSQIQGKNYWEKTRKFSEYLNNMSHADKFFQPEFSEYLNETGHQIEVDPVEIDMLDTLTVLYQRWIPLAHSEKFTLLLDEILEHFNIRSLLAAQTDGDQKLANLDKLVHLVYEFEQSSSTLLADLLEILQKQISGETGEGEAVIMAEEEDKVKILTYHSAKGMEFPVIFLPYLEKGFQYGRQFFFDQTYGFAADLDRFRTDDSPPPFAYSFLQLRDRQKIQAEEKRLLYVAMTRARDYLFLVGAIKKSGKVPEPTYLHWILDSNESPSDLTDCNTQILNFPDLTVELKPATELLPEKISGEKKSGKETEPVPVLSHPLKYQDPLKIQPDHQVYTVTRLMIFGESRERYLNHYYLNEGEIPRLDTEEDFIDEPGGALWGSLVHNLLENFHLRNSDQDADRINQLLKSFPLPEGSDSSDLYSLLENFIRKFRQSPFAQSIQKDEFMSEYPVDMRIDDFILRGIFDVLHRNKHGIWEVIDYKTNRVRGPETDSLMKKYEFQVRAYSLLLSGLFPAQSVYPVSLYFLEPDVLKRREFNLLEIETTRTHITQLMKELFEWEVNLLYSPDFIDKK